MFPISRALYRRPPLRFVLPDIVLAAIGLLSAGAPAVSAESVPPLQLPIAGLKPTVTILLGKTADWVAVTPDAIWVGSTGPNAVHRIDPKTQKLVATVRLDGDPCAGLAVGFGSLWIPLCGATPALVKVDLASNAISAVFKTGPAAAESGIAASADSIWMPVDKAGSFARIDPQTGAVRQTVKLPAGSYNPTYAAGRLWVSRADGAELTSVDAATGKVLTSTATGPGPRFLTSGAGAVWTLNQGDGTLTRVDTASSKATRTVPLKTPGQGGDIAFGAGMVWTTMPKTPLSVVDATSGILLCQWVGAGGDSLGIDSDAIWLTDYNGGTVSRIERTAITAQCPAAAAH